MKTLPLIIPYPPVLLSPNQRPHWAAKSRAKAQHRLACRLAVEEQLRWLGEDQEREKMLHPTASYGRLHVELVAYRPGVCDKDNLLASLKAGIDGVADALLIDDERIDWGAVEFRPSTRKLARVLLLFSAAEARGARAAGW